MNVYYLSVKGSVKLGVKFSVMFHTFTALTETTFAPKPKVALRVYCVAVRSAILATAWLLVYIFVPSDLDLLHEPFSWEE